MSNTSQATVHMVEGTLSWCKLFEHNKDTHPGFFGDCDGAFTIDVILDKENMDTHSASGSRGSPRIADEGLTVKYKRKNLHPSVPALGGPPKVVDSEEKPWDPAKSIGNGSKGQVWFEVYDTKMGKGTRLMAVKVLDLVEYERPVGEDGEPVSDNRLPF